MKQIFIALILVFSAVAFSGQLDLRKFQYPVEDAKASAKSPVPRFCSFVLSSTSKPRLPGVSRDKIGIVLAKYRTKIMNEFRLYEQGPIGNQEKILLERYCTRYNRMLITELGI
jgi:hypothetical protein